MTIRPHRSRPVPAPSQWWIVLSLAAALARSAQSAAPPPPPPSLAAFRPPPASPKPWRSPPRPACPALGGGSSSSSPSASGETTTASPPPAAGQAAVRLPPPSASPLVPTTTENNKSPAATITTTATLEAAAAAARGSTSGAESVLLERVGSKDVEIRLPAAFTPLERIAVSAEGDLQRIVASYYNAAVAVAIRRCEEVAPGVFDREVDLSVRGQVFCTATSSLAPRTAECARLLREQGLGLGQLFRHLKVHPDFKLLEVGKTPHKGFWRLYELDCPGVLNCRILESFRPDTFHLEAELE